MSKKNALTHSVNNDFTPIAKNQTLSLVDTVSKEKVNEGGQNNIGRTLENKDRNQPLFVHLPRLKKDIKTPITYVQLGVLGDLCLSRVNQEIFDYHQAQTDTPIRTVFLCDTFVKIDSSSGKEDFLAYLYKKCNDFNSVNLYFTSPFLQAIKDAELKSSGQSLTEGEIRNLFSIYKETSLTKLGFFLMDNYQCTKAEGSQAVDTLMSKAPDETNWIFFLAIAPDYYEDFINAVFKYFTFFKKKDESKKIFLLEKPFQTNAIKSSVLSKKLNALHNAYPNFKFFAVDHYAAKWSIAHIHYLMAVSYTHLTLPTKRIV